MYFISGGCVKPYKHNKNSVYTSNKLGVAAASYKQGTAGEVNTCTYSTLARLEETEHLNEINRISKIIPYKSGVFFRA